jgi:hypothetical protein
VEIILCVFNFICRDDGLIIGEYLIFKTVTKDDFATYRCTISNGHHPKVFNVTLIEGGKCSGILESMYSNAPIKFSSLIPWVIIADIAAMSAECKRLPFFQSRS